MLYDLVALTGRGLHTAGALLLVGTLACVQLSPRPTEALVGWRSRWLRAAMLLAMSTLALGLGVLALQIVAVESSAPWPSVAQRLLLESRFGSVWIAREACMVAAAASLALGLLRPGATGAPWLALLFAGTGLALAPLSGHSAAEEPAWPMLTIHATHLLAAGAWWGALPALAALIADTRSDDVRAAALRTFQRFSSAALWLMLAIVGSGVALAVTHVETWPALLATGYGALLLCKVALLAVVAALAARLRWRLLPALAAGAGPEVQRRTGAWILAECGVAAAIVLLAAQLGQSIPARHDAIEWWLPFRFSVNATWDIRWTPLKVWSGIALVALAGAAAALALLGRVPRRGGFAGAAVLATAAGAAALPALSVQAYPDTYRKPSIAYQTVSVAAGADLFATHCTRCHGPSGHGDGLQAKTLPLPPADLTEPHTALHTAGDMFWWLTHGKPPGVMPGFPAVLAEDDRWDLINFLRTLSSGYQGRLITERAVPRRPWLPAVDFNYVTADGTSGTLKDFRERAVTLLVFFRPDLGRARLEQLAGEYETLRAAGAEVLAIPIGAAPSGWPFPFPLVVDGSEETVRTYALMRRTLSDADPRDERPRPEHMEFLVDRFGYVRARWLPAAGEGWRDLGLLRQQIALLAQEQKILPPPDDHVH